MAATDYMRAFAEQIRPSVPSDRRYVVLGTDGFGRSDYRKALRRHFEVDRHYVVVATLSALAAEGMHVGDRVLFGKWSGTEVKIDGQDLLIMKESDIMGVVA